MRKEDNVLIVTGGSVEKSLVREVLEGGALFPKNPYIIGVDKGLEVLDELDVPPDLAIGDFDSASGRIKEKYEGGEHCVVLNTKKDFTDTHAAVCEAIKLAPKKALLLGATGSRLDHTMANLGILKLLLKENIQGQILDSHNRITLIARCLTVKRETLYGPYLSLIPYSERVTGVTLQGFLYDVSDLTMIKEDSIGVSNELREEEGHITVGDGYLLVMETKD